MAATPETDPAPVADPPQASVAIVGPPVQHPEPTSKQPVVLATENHITEFIAGDVHVTHAGVAVGKKQADDLTELAARHGVRLVDITPEKGE